jgi:hypothetical protein
MPPSRRWIRYWSGLHILNVGLLAWDYTALYHLSSSYSAPWEPEISLSTTPHHRGRTNFFVCPEQVRTHAPHVPVLRTTKQNCNCTCRFVRVWNLVSHTEETQVEGAWADDAAMFVYESKNRVGALRFDTGEFRNLYSSSNNSITRVTKSRSMTWVVHVACNENCS